jgi:eukaryotic-like serine/threonine-protein kinase
MTTCPSDATLRKIGTDSVGEATFAGLEEHVEQCSDCQSILEAAMNAVPQATHAVPVRNALPTLPGLVIERELGRGGACVVYLAWEPALKRHVAVKLFPRNTLVDPHTREHWLAEARALSRVPNDHVVAIHRVDETPEWLCLVIEYVSGGTLKDRLTEPLAPRDAARLMETIARAVGYFDTRGVCHLDLKPSNILIEGDPGAPWEIVSPKISDFGIARLEGEPGMTETGANGPKGTPSYMAPEQVAALPGTIGAAADIHALGALLYHLLTGRPPFQGASSSETLDQVRNQDPVPPRRLNGRIPRDLETICLKCLEKVPSRRYRTAEAVAGDLRLWLESRPIKARRVSPIGHAWRLCRRRPAIAGLLVALATTLATAVVGLFVLLNQAAAERARSAESRRNAEAYEKFSADAAKQLVVFLASTVHSRQTTTHDEQKATLLKLQRSTNDLKSRGIVAPSTLGILEGEIGWALVELSKPEEARGILNHAVADLRRSLAKTPEDREVRHYLGNSLFYSGSLAEDADQTTEALNYFEQSVGVELAMKPRAPFCWLLTKLYRRLQVLADRFAQSGQPAENERSRHLSQRILQHLLGSDLEDSMDVSSLGIETLGRLFRRADLKRMWSHEDKATRDTCASFAADWLAISVRSLSPFRSPSSAATYGQDPEAEAIALISTVREWCSNLGLADSFVCAAIDIARVDAVSIASRQRRAGRLDDARATAARLMTLGRRLVSEYPNSAYSYYVLSSAHDQIKKNAVDPRDDNLIEESLVRAIEAGRRSLVLDPDWTEARLHLDKLTKQLVSIKAKRNASVSSIP